MKKQILVVLFSIVDLSILWSQDLGIVNASILNVRSSPSINSSIVLTLHEGDTVAILQRHGSSTWDNNI